VGAVLGYRLVEAALERLPVPPDRLAVEIASGHPGSGMEDAFEYLLRAVSGGRYRRVSFETGPVVAGAAGRFRFAVRAGGFGLDLQLRDGVLDPRLFAPPEPGDAAARLTRQLEAAAGLLAAGNEALFAINAGHGFPE
jgi:hypothetical protein